MLQLLSPARRHLHAPAARVPPARGEQPRLPDPGLTLDQHDQQADPTQPGPQHPQDRDLRRTPADARDRRQRPHEPDATP